MTLPQKLALHTLLLLYLVIRNVKGSTTSCMETLNAVAGPLATVTFSVHRSGEPDACGSAVSDIGHWMKALKAQASCEELDKYRIESLLTEYFHTTEGCQLGNFCDMGKDKTVIQRDHQSLVTTSSGLLPCRWFTREGLRISSLQQLVDLSLKRESHECSTEDVSEECKTTKDLHLFAVPAGRMFMFAPSYVGERFTLDHVQDSEGNTVELEVLSTNPRVFDIHNFFNQRESDSILQKALSETSETHRFHRSTTGTSGKSTYSKRTSENAWDTHGREALIIKRRCFNLLGLEYEEAMADGLQILRYNLTTAYIPHMDYLEDRSGRESYDYDSSGKGGNRFATILLYFTDLGERDGGETVFPKAWPPDVAVEDRIELDEAIQQLRASGDGLVLQEGSWEEQMAAECRTRLSIRPRATRAVLFYSQLPNGEEDPMSLHGGCPVLTEGTPKIAANLWTWSGIRPEYDGAPRKFEPEPRAQPSQKSAVFKNVNKDPRFDKAEVYYDESGFFGKLGPYDNPVYVNTYEGHVWNIKDSESGETLQTFVIDNRVTQQVFEF